jgi:uncharacterized membrane protein YfcA
LLAVFLGGQIGSRLGSVVLPERLLKKLTAILMMYVAARLLIRWQNLVG